MGTIQQLVDAVSQAHECLSLICSSVLHKDFRPFILLARMHDSAQHRGVSRSFSFREVLRGSSHNCNMEAFARLSLVVEEQLRILCRSQTFCQPSGTKSSSISSGQLPMIFARTSEDVIVMVGAGVLGATGFAGSLPCAEFDGWDIADMLSIRLDGSLVVIKLPSAVPSSSPPLYTSFWVTLDRKPSSGVSRAQIYER